MPYVHLVAHLIGDLDFLAEEPVAGWLWGKLRQRFPVTASAQLMPNHLHLLTEVDEPEVARDALARTCGHLGRRFGLGRVFERLPTAEVIPPKRMPRVARYVDLNSTRAGLVASPLQWAWTTLRDLVGAVADPWIDARRHKEALRSGHADSIARWLTYVAADDTVGDRKPLAPPVDPSPDAPAFGLEALAQACAAACRVPPAELGSRADVRRLFVALCQDQGVRDTDVIARRCAVSRRTVQRALHDPPEARALQAARQCLADPRLRSPAPAPRRPLSLPRLLSPVCSRRSRPTRPLTCAQPTALSSPATSPVPDVLENAQPARPSPFATSRSSDLRSGHRVVTGRGKTRP